MTIALLTWHTRSVSLEIRRWQEAARVRDAILTRAAGEPSLRRCGSFVTSGAAGSVDGAFVFHNGLLQALGAAAAANAHGACRVAWNGADLTVTPD